MDLVLESDLDHVLAHTGHVWDALRKQSILITGGTGFVGTWLVESLVRANNVLGTGVRLVLVTRNPEAFRAKAPHLASHQSVELLKGDAHSFAWPEGEFRFVIHGATEKTVPSTPEHPVPMLDLDIAATKYLLEFARTHGTRRFLFTSSGAVYGRQPSELTHTPEDYAGAPLTTDLNSAYGQGKRISEFLCSLYAKNYGFASVVARLFAFSGPYLPLDLNFAIGNFVGDVLNGGPIRIGGDGTPYRSYLYAADLAIWLLVLLVHGESGRPYNVGSGEDLQIKDLAHLVAKHTNPATAIEIAGKPKAGAPVLRYVPDVNLAKRELGLVPFISLAESISRMYQWNLTQHSRPQAS
jgi:nucleoside-diphosphate-sugar epimerase